MSGYPGVVILISVSSVPRERYCLSHLGPAAVHSFRPTDMPEPGSTAMTSILTSQQTVTFRDTTAILTRAKDDTRTTYNVKLRAARLFQCIPRRSIEL